ncbi:MAG TPA: peptidylprolyl isomerase [Pyrinomonadaceae bacterium]|jgi:peptidylprolyl isomerase
MPEQAKKGDTAQVHYTGRLKDGQVFDSSEGGEPLEFEIGAGNVIQGFDEGVRGMSQGDKKRIEIEADEAYGPRIDALVQQIAREGLNLDREPEVGMQLGLQMPDGQEIPVTITEVTKDSITLDANHPLAGQKLIFDIELVKLKQGKPEQEAEGRESGGAEQ